MLLQSLPSLGVLNNYWIANHFMIQFISHILWVSHIFSSEARQKHPRKRTFCSPEIFRVWTIICSFPFLHLYLEPLKQNGWKWSLPTISYVRIWFIIQLKQPFLKKVGQEENPFVFSKSACLERHFGNLSGCFARLMQLTALKRHRGQTEGILLTNRGERCNGKDLVHEILWV